MIPFYEKNDNQLRIFCSGGLTFPDHLHNALELVYMESGNLKIGIQGNEFELKEGDFACIFPEVIHHYEETQGCPSGVLIAICGPQILGETMPLLHNQCPLNPVIRKKDVPEEIVYAIRGLTKEQHGERQPLIEKGLMLYLLGNLLPMLTLQKLDLPGSYQLIQDLISYIGEHFQEKLSLSILAEKLCVNKYHLSRIFSNKLHMSFPDYVNQIRLEYATSLIRKADLDFLEIALESGFESQRTFNRSFQKLYGMTPSEYAKSLQK